MNYEERLRYRELIERTGELQERLAEGEASASVTREEGRELAALLEEALLKLSPERFDRMMETIAQEAARRAGAVAPMK